MENQFNILLSVIYILTVIAVWRLWARSAEKGTEHKRTSFPSGTLGAIIAPIIGFGFIRFGTETNSPVLMSVVFFLIQLAAAAGITVLSVKQKKQLILKLFTIAFSFLAPIYLMKMLLGQAELKIAVIGFSIVIQSLGYSGLLIQRN